MTAELLMFVDWQMDVQMDAMINGWVAECKDGWMGGKTWFKGLLSVVQ
jgi:hypothetical protein